MKALMSNKYGSDKNSLLHLAAERGHIDLVDDILKEGIDVNVLNNKGQSPIYLAAEKGHLNVVKLLLKKGANPISAISYGMKSNDLELLKVLLVGRNISLLDKTSGINFPAFHVLNNRYIEHRKISDRKVKKYNKIISVSITVSAVAMAIYVGSVATTIYSGLILAAAVGVFAIAALMIMSDLARRYIENEFQKEISKELEKQCEPQEDISVLETTQEVEPILDVNSRCRQ